ncbi:MAG: MTH1187 family thiamine-binding protein [Thermodesulfobacteria bacterium]|nr:MTH1187 family thiamine-binding protein [Thermodesulfobacteriota bacterium]
MSVLVEFSIFPLDKGESVSEYVARVLKIVKNSGVEYVLTPMATIVETEDPDSAMELIKKCIKELEKDCNRIILNLKMDYRKGKSGRLTGKVKSVEEKLGEKLKTI